MITLDELRAERDELIAQLRLICNSDNDNICRAGYINAARDLLAKYGQFRKYPEVQAYYGTRRGGSGVRSIDTAVEAEKILRGAYGVTTVRLETADGEVVGMRWRGDGEHARKWLWSFDPDYFPLAPKLAPSAP